MKKIEAIKVIANLSSGTIALLTGETNYSAITIIVNKWIAKIDSMSEDAFKDCENWMNVLDIIR